MAPALASSKNGLLAGRFLRVVGGMDLSPCDGCDGCGLRCTSGVQISSEEAEAVRAYAADPANAAYVSAVARQDKAVDLGDGVVVEACRFRDMERGLCAIYPARPLVCRLLGHVEWLPCPIEKVPMIVPTEDAVALMQSYAAEERRTIEEWDLAAPEDK